eukprot:gnl/Hemi2/10732_TR3687_c0_g2_i1.p1 gnl/Hemi2/10732_TR3687_c0_g2~~gnl/Hemi2/10732_TR3687_c0_g2_i1.p1  ORF type:complete len:196 (-),score=58.34 gnl/Hemi2/10732_TR3687_c0_g2_i1:92-679(-)
MALDLLGWESPRDLSSTISVPKGASQFFQVGAYGYKGSWATHCPSNLFERENAEHPSPRREVLKYVSNLSNNVIQKQALQWLTSKKQQQPALFSSPSMVFRVYRLMEYAHFSLTVRRFLHELFDGAVFTQDFFDNIDKESRPRRSSNKQSRGARDRNADQDDQDSAMNYSDSTLSLAPDQLQQQPFDSAGQPDLT